MRWLILIFTIIPIISQASNPTRIAVIDTGISSSNFPLCPTGHFDYSLNKETVGIDDIGHGNNIVQAIMSEAKGNYCFIILKINKGAQANSGDIAKAITRSIDYGASVINISLTGDSPSAVEYNALKYADSKNAIIFVAAGNKSKNLNNNCSIFPACYKNLKNMVVVGSSELDKKKFSSFSNYGKQVKITAYGCYNDMCGTSQSTAKITGKFINYIQGRFNEFQ